MSSPPPAAARDALARRGRTLALYGLPIGAIVAAGQLGSARTVTVVWPLAFAVMGVACVVNALRCRRVHCYFTGPLFLLAAGLSVLHGTGILPLGPRGWDLIGNGALLGALVLYFGPERVWGKYF